MTTNKRLWDMGAELVETIPHSLEVSPVRNVFEPVLFSMYCTGSSIVSVCMRHNAGTIVEAGATRTLPHWIIPSVLIDFAGTTAGTIQPAQSRDHIHTRNVYAS